MTDTTGAAVTATLVTAVRPADRSAVTSAAGLAVTAVMEALIAVAVALSAAVTSNATSTPASSRRRPEGVVYALMAVMLMLEAGTFSTLDMPTVKDACAAVPNVAGV